MEKFRNTKQAPISTSNMSIERARQAESNAAKILIGTQFWTELQRFKTNHSI